MPLFLVSVIQRPKLSWRWKLQGGFFCASLLLIIALLVAMITLFSNTQALRTLNDSQTRATHIRQISDEYAITVNSLFSYLQTNNPQQVNVYKANREAFFNEVATYQPIPSQRSTYTQLNQELKNFSTLLDQLLALKPQNSPQTSPDLSTLNALSVNLTNGKISGLLRDLSEEETRSLEINYNQALERANTSEWVVAVLIVVGMIVAIAVVWLLTVALLRPLTQLKERLAKLAQGDLTQPVQIANGDELGELGQTYNLTLVSLRQLVNQLYLQSQQVSGISQELNSQVHSQVSGSSQQVSSITEATAAIQELSQAAAEIARQAQQTSGAVEQSLELADAVNNLADEMVEAQGEGRQLVAQTLTALNSLKEQTAAINEQQQSLLAQTGVIKEVITLMDSIAKETHLLALNASIEAAGVGIYGERFRVIASEVKNLADRTMKATSQVGEALISIVRAVTEVSTQTRQETAGAEQAVHDSQQSDLALVRLTKLSAEVKNAVERIVEEISGAALMAKNIGAATTQQQGASQQMLERMVEIEGVTSQNLNSLRQGEKAIYMLNQNARQLENSADTFKLSAAATN